VTPYAPVLEETAGELGGPAAGFWRRLAGALIDGILLGIVETILRLITGDVGQLLGLLISIGYFTHFHGTTGQTPGNAAVGIRVVDARDNLGRPIGYRRAFVRWAVSLLSALVVLLGFLWMLWDPNKQTWHDKAAGSLPLYVGH
jgi:uncharacterized RDD family membrane protein YckC